MQLAILLILDVVFFVAALLFMYESVREQEPRAPYIGLAGVIVTIVLAGLIWWVPSLHGPLMVAFLIVIAFAIVFVIPTTGNPRALKGTDGYVEGDVKRVDERDIVFARNRSLPPGSEVYKKYYEMHPELQERDDARRAMGGPVGRPGSIDKGHRANVSMVASTFTFPTQIGPHAVPQPDASREPAEVDPARASQVAKGFALHLGAVVAGVCKVDPRWAYSHRGEIFYDNWEDWGSEIPKPLPYAVVFGTEMDVDLVGAGPHTPAVVESGTNYAQGAYISTMLAGWFAHMGYKASAQHHRHYDLLMVPPAVDAGLGEMGRFGYLITDRYGPRVRVFAVTTDMPLQPDEPVDLGIEQFCEACKKCATTCPSRSIPVGETAVSNGVDKWKLNEETCFEYWGRIGTDCSICMGICPYSRPYRSVHKVVRWMLKRSTLARKVFPHIDNVMYGEKWSPRKPPNWVDHRK